MGSIMFTNNTSAADNITKQRDGSFIFSFQKQYSCKFFGGGVFVEKEGDGTGGSKRRSCAAVGGHQRCRCCEVVGRPADEGSTLFISV